MRILVVDDEAPARRRLRRLLEIHSDLEVIGEATDGLSALRECDRLKPDAVFLDIEMPELSGLAVAEALGNDGPAIVFVTAYDAHALKAFEVAAVDYVVKPIDEARLVVALERLRSRRQRRGSPDYPAVAKTISTAPRRLAIRSGAKFVVFDPKDVSAILAKDHYAVLLVDGRELLADDTLDGVARRLNDDAFVRVHRSAIVNLAFIQELEREGDRKYVAVLKGPGRIRVPISRERLPELRQLLGIEDDVN